MSMTWSWYRQLKIKIRSLTFKTGKLQNWFVMKAEEDRKVQNKLLEVKTWSVYERGCMIWCLHRQGTGLRNSFSSWRRDVPSPLAYCSYPGQKSAWSKNFLPKSYLSEDAGRRNVNVSSIVTETDGSFWERIEFFQGPHSSRMINAISKLRQKIPFMMIWKLLIYCEVHTMALTEVLSALLIFLWVQYSEKFYRTQSLVSHFWVNLSFYVKKTQNK